MGGHGADRTVRARHGKLGRRGAAVVGIALAVVPVNSRGIVGTDFGSLSVKIVSHIQQGISFIYV